MDRVRRTLLEAVQDGDKFVALPFCDRCTAAEDGQPTWAGKYMLNDMHAAADMKLLQRVAMSARNYSSLGVEEDEALALLQRGMEQFLKARDAWISALRTADDTRRRRELRAQGRQVFADWMRCLARAKAGVARAFLRRLYGDPAAVPAEVCGAAPQQQSEPGLASAEEPGSGAGFADGFVECLKRELAALRVPSDFLAASLQDALRKSHEMAIRIDAEWRARAAAMEAKPPAPAAGADPASDSVPASPAAAAAGWSPAEAEEAPELEAGTEEHAYAEEIEVAPPAAAGVGVGRPEPRAALR
eukprot:tig00020610_g12013.t1